MKHKSIEEIFEDCEVLVPYRSALKPKISVIVRIHGVRQYLEQCLDSVLSQSLKEIEIILANDCSPDPLEDEMCMKYAQKDERVVYLRTTKNLRQWGGTVCGLKVSQAPYIGIVDGDDWIEERMYEVMLDKLLKNDVDVVQVGMNIDFAGKRKWVRVLEGYGLLPKGIDEKVGIVDKSFYSSKDFKYFRCTFPTHLIKKSIFENKNFIHPLDLKAYEDELTWLQVVFYSKKLLSIRDKLYNYRIRSGSTMRSMEGVSKFMFIADVLTKLFQYLGYFYQINGVINLIEYKGFYNHFIRKIIRHKIEIIYGIKSLKNRERYFIINQFKYKIVTNLDVDKLSPSFLKNVYLESYKARHRYIKLQLLLIHWLKKMGLIGFIKIINKPFKKKTFNHET